MAETCINYEIVTIDPDGSRKVWLIWGADDREEAERDAQKAAALFIIEDYENYDSDSVYYRDLEDAADTIEIVSVIRTTRPEEGRAITNTARLISASAAPADDEEPDEA